MPSNVVALRRANAQPSTSNERELTKQLDIQTPLTADDSGSVLTITPGSSGAKVEVETTIKVPDDGRDYDGLVVKLQQTEADRAEIQGEGLKDRLTAPALTMDDMFERHVANRGAVIYAGTHYTNSEIVRDSGAVILSRFEKNDFGVPLLSQRRLDPKNGAMVTPPPKYTLVGAKEPKEEPAVIAAHSAEAKLPPGSTFSVTGPSIERIEAVVGSSVQPKVDWSDPKGAEVTFKTWLKVKNTDRAPISHAAISLRSGDSAQGRNSGPTTPHTTDLPGANLLVKPRRSQQIEVEEQEGFAHVEYRLENDMSSREGDGDEETELTAGRVMVLDRTNGDRHAGGVTFLDKGGLVTLGKASVSSAMPGRSSVASDEKSSGVSANAQTTWSKRTPGADAKHEAQTVTASYDLENISRVAGQMKLEVAIQNFSSLDSVKINGEEMDLDRRRFAHDEVAARLQVNRYGGSKLNVSLLMPPGTNDAPAKKKLDIEIKGQIEIEVPNS
jgi:hypothetical protein